MVQNLLGRRAAVNGGLIIFLVALLTCVLALIALDQALLAIVAGLGLLIVLAILAKPDFATLVVLFILYTNAAVIAVQFHNVPNLVGASLPALLVFPLTSYVIIRREPIVMSPILVPIFLLFGVQVVGTLFAIQLDDAINNLITFVSEGLGLYFLIINVVRTPQQLRRATWTIILAGTLIGMISFYQQITGTYQNDYWGFAQMSNATFSTGQSTIQGNVEQWRLAGPIGEKNRYAQVMLMLVPLGMFRVWGERKLLLRILAIVCTGFITFGAALAFSRGAAVGFVMMLVIMAFMRYIKLYQILIIFLGLLLLLEALPQYSARLNSLEGMTALFSDGETNTSAADGATLSRLTEMGAAGLVFLDYPVIGVGPGMFRYYYQDYAELVGLRVQSKERSAHNLYLQVAAEYGALGLICFLAVVYLSLRNLGRIRRRWMKEQPELSNMATAYMLAIVTYLTTGLFLHFAFIRYFWLIMGLAGAVIYISEQHALAASRRAAEEQASAPAALQPAAL